MVKVGLMYGLQHGGPPSSNIFCIDTGGGGGGANIRNEGPSNSIIPGAS